jgi:membrane-bound ClpP family serine protease
MGFNSEIAAGLAILLLGIIFVFAGLVNTTWGEIMLADFVIIALGAATLGIGIWTHRYDVKHSVHTHHH